MKRFVFTLEKVLEYRRSLEEERGRDLAAATAELNQCEEALASLEDRRRKSMELWVRQQASAPMSAGLLKSSGFGVNALAEAEHLGREALAAARRRFDLSRQRYEKARIDLEAVVRLKEKRRAEWGVEAQRAEQAALDEMIRQHTQHHSDRFGADS